MGGSWRMFGHFDIYTLSEYGDTSWHVARNESCNGKVIDEVDGVASLDDAKTYVYKMTCSNLLTKYEDALSFIKYIETYKE
jgi:hypothetical protein